jgi:hypothetical protein
MEEALMDESLDHQSEIADQLKKLKSDYAKIRSKMK